MDSFPVERNVPNYKTKKHESNTSSQQNNPHDGYYSSLESLTNRMQRLLDNPVLADIIFEVPINEMDEKEGFTTIKAHKSILAASCEPFRAMFAGQFAESKPALGMQRVAKQRCKSANACYDAYTIQNLSSTYNTEETNKIEEIQANNNTNENLQNQMEECTIQTVRLREISAIVFKKVLQYVYTGKIVLNGSIALDLLAAADKFQLLQLKSFCEHFISNAITVDDVCMLYEIAHRYNATQLVSKCWTFLTARGSDIFDGKNNGITHLSRDTILALITSNDLTINNELHLFNSIIVWAEHIVKQQDEKSQAAEKQQPTKKEVEPNQQVNIEQAHNSNYKPQSKSTNNLTIKKLKVPSNSSASSTLLPPIPTTSAQSTSSETATNFDNKSCRGSVLSSESTTTAHQERLKEVLCGIVEHIQYNLIAPQDLHDYISPLNVVPKDLLVDALYTHCGVVSNKLARKSYLGRGRVAEGWSTDISKKSRSIKVRANVATNMLSCSKRFRSVMGKKTFIAGKYYASIYLEQTNGCILVGVCTNNVDVESGCYLSQSWMYYCLDGKKYHRNNGEVYNPNVRCKTGDTIGILIDLPSNDPLAEKSCSMTSSVTTSSTTTSSTINNSSSNYSSPPLSPTSLSQLQHANKGSIEFFQNGKSLGVAYNNVIGPVYLAVDMYYKGDKVRLAECKRIDT